MQIVQGDQAKPENFLRFDEVTDIAARKFPACRTRAVFLDWSLVTINLKNAEVARDKRPIEENCTCPACREFSRGYIRHLIKADEILGLRLITLHNLHFYLYLMNRARTEIERQSFDKFRRASVAEYKTRDATTAA